MPVLLVLSPVFFRLSVNKPDSLLVVLYDTVTLFFAISLLKVLFRTTPNSALKRQKTA